MKNPEFEGLRKKAEELLAQSDLPQPEGHQKMLEVLHELSVHQIELEVQNEELRDTQQRLQDVKNDYFELYEFAPVGYMNLDQDGRILSINLTAVRLFGLPRNKLLGRFFSEFVDQAYHNTFYRHLEKVPQQSKTVSCELGVYAADHTPLHIRLESFFAGLTIRGDRTIRSAMVDMTELNQARQKLHRLNTELEKRVEDRNALACKRLEQIKQLNLDLIRAEQRERQRLAVVLHDDLQQILIGCKYHLSFLRSHADEAQKEEFMSRMEETLKQAIDISRSLSHELYPPALCHSGLAAALNWFGVQIKKLHGLQVQICLSSQHQRFAREIEIFLFQCARELLLNIVKHAKTDTARMTLEYRDDAIRLQVADSGAGFDSRHVQNDGEPEEGFGLLNIKRRIETMGGTFDVCSAPGHGCQITLTLPCVPEECLAEQVPEPVETPTEAPVAHPATAKKGQIKLMLVDDHRIIRQGLVRLLEVQPDIAIIAEAESGRKAVEMARAFTPEVILMDISMPEMDGIEATSRITQEHPGTHVIGLTLHEEDWMIDRMLEAGACRYLTKNAPAEELIKAIRAAAAGTAFAQ